MKGPQKIYSPKRILSLLIVILLLLADCFTVLAAEEDGNIKKEEKVIRVAFPEAKGINMVNEDGTYGGCTYDWLMEIAKYTGWTYEFITEGDTSEQINLLRNGECDIMGGMYYREEYEEWYSYPKYAMGSNYSLLIYPRSDETIKSYDLSTLNGKKIGVFRRAVAKIERLQEYLQFNNISCELVYYDDSDAYQNCLENEEVDLMLGTDVYIKDHYNVAAMLPAESYYLVTSANQPELCQEMSRAIESIYESDPNFATELYSKYFPDKYINSITFTEEEKTFMEECEPLRVAVIKDRYPMYFEEDGKVKGIIPETLKLITERTGLQFEYVTTATHKDRIELMQEGGADLVGGFLDDDAAADSFNLSRTSCIVTMDSVILRNKKCTQTENMVMAVPRGRVIEPANPGDTIKYYDTYKECLDAVNSHEDVDYTRMAASVVGDFFSKDYYANITMVTDMDLTDEVTLALPLPVNVTLYSILNKAINNFSEAETRTILTQNTLSLSEGEVTLKSLFHTNPSMVVGIVIGIIILLSAIIIMISFFHMKAKIMQMKLEKVEETSKTKSAFLARMSHEIRTPMNAIIGLTNLTKLSGEATPKVQENLSKIDSSAKFLLSILNDVLDMSKIENEMMKIEPAPFSMSQLLSELESMFSAQAAEKELQFKISCDLRDSNFIGDKMRIQQVLTNLLSNSCKFTDKGGVLELQIEERIWTSAKAQLRFSVRDTGIGIDEEDVHRIFDSFEQVKNSNLRAPGTGLGLSISRRIVELMGGELQVTSEPGKGSEFYFTIDLPVYSGKLSEEDNVVQETSAGRLCGMRVLLAEDNDLNAEIAIELMKLVDIKVERAVNGEEAVQLFAKSEEGFFDIILMDVNMPEKDGLTATEEIRRMERPDAAVIPIVAMTANTFQDDWEKALQSGMTGFLPKPFDVNQLYQILQQTERGC